MTDAARPHERFGGRDDSRGSLLELAALVGAGVGLGTALWWLSGPPHIPAGWPGWEEALEVLSGSNVDYESVISVIASLGWLALAYLASAVAMRTVARALVSLSDGAGWARSAFRLSNFVTIPVVRRIVDGGLAGILVGAIWVRGGSGSEASVPASGPNIILSVGAEASLPDLAAELAPAANVSRNTSTSGDTVISYTVVEGDNLWDISRRLYGDGTLYTMIFRANEGRIMESGEAFLDPRLIRPGWVLDVPLPAHNAWRGGNNLMYRVRPNDSLWRISENLLGEGLRWTEIWDLNQGREIEAGRQFINPSYILPSWILELPVEVTAPTANQNSELQMPSSYPAPQSTPAVVPATTPSRDPVPTVRWTAPPVEQSRKDDSDGSLWPSVLAQTVLAAGGALAASGAVALLVREVARRNGRPAVGPGRVRARGKASGRGDVGRVVLAARALIRGLAEFGFDDLQVIIVRESERFMEFTLECAPGDADAVVRSRYELARRLACAVDADVVAPTRIRMKLSRFQRLAGLLMNDERTRDHLLLVPVGAAESGVHYLNLAAVGNAAIAGRTHEAWKLVSAWLATLGAVHSPKELAFLLAGSGVEVEALRSDPHFAEDAGRHRGRSIDDLAAEMEKAILAREAASAVRGAAANIVAVAALSEEHKAEIERLETALRRGPEHGITTICFGEQVDDSLNVFGARLAFGESGAGPEEWALLLGRDPALILKPVEVRKEVLRPRLRLDEGADQWESKAPAEPIEGIADDVRDAESDEEAALPGGQLKESVADASEEADVGGLSEPPARTDSALNVPTAQVRRQATLLLVNEESAEVQAPEAASPVSIRTFGSFQVIANEREITDWKLQKARELLAYLVARGGTHVLRDEAAEALWPDEGVVQVDHLLSNAAHYLRRAIKGALPNPNVQVLLVSGQRYRLRPGLFRVDVDALDAHLRRAGMLKGTDALVEYERALAVYRGDFLGNEPFEWADAYRSEYQRRFAAAAHEAARLALDCRDARKAMKFYQAIIDRDPIDEKAARGLMRCCAKLGDTNGVRKVYKVFRESLRRELDDVKVEPLPETTALFHEFTVRSHGS